MHLYQVLIYAPNPIIFLPSCYSNSLPRKKFVNSTYILATWHENSNIQRAYDTMYLTYVFSVRVKKKKLERVHSGWVLKELRGWKCFPSDRI
jgi:hypothetical protein